jgi:chemotaxis protein methyltransferase CheR
MMEPMALQGGPAIRPDQFETIRTMVYNFCGVDLTGKQVLVESRLRKKIQDAGFASTESYLKQVRQNPDSVLFTSMIDVLTTNHTSFYRERQHFDLLRDVIAPAIPAPEKIAIWSAACSSGEEPYTIAFSLFEALGDAALTRTRILATDVSTRVLEKARRGLYPVTSVKDVPRDICRRCLLKGCGEHAHECLVKQEVRQLVEFEKFNLLGDCSSYGPFHVIFCRNVMIYFDKKTQETVVNKLATRLLPGGYLMVGHSESLSGVQHPLNYVMPATYQKAGGRASHLDKRVTGLRRSR